jgi:hypothetical protein
MPEFIRNVDMVGYYIKVSGAAEEIQGLISKAENLRTKLFKP